MTCHFHHSLDTLLKTDEPAYLVNIAYERKRRSREEIIDIFTPNNEKRIRERYGVSPQEYIDKLVKIENQTFGNLDSAFVPSGRYLFASKTNLEKAKSQLEELMKPFSEPREKWKIIYTEIKGRTTDARKDLHSQCGLTLVEHEGLTRKKWQEKLNNFVDLAKKQSFVSKVYLAGSLTRDVDSSKDADVIMVTSHCPGQCEVFQKLKSTNLKFGGLVSIIGQPLAHYPIDLYCFNEDEFNSLVEGKYRIAQNIKLLFKI